MNIFDSHCHLNHDDFKGHLLKEAYDRAINSGVTGMMIVGYDEESSFLAKEIADRSPHAIASVGIHPHDAITCDGLKLERLISLAAHKKVRAWGEIGLDFNRMYSPRKNQESCFLRQLEIADQLNFPIIIHERDSEGRLIELLKEHPDPKRKAVVHCFSGNQTELDRYLEFGFSIGITGIVTIKSRGKVLRSLIRGIPLDRLLIETDAPYLIPAPEKNRMRRNEPAFVKSVLIKLSELLDVGVEELAETTSNNALRLFEER